MDQEQLNAIRERYEETTEGPWYAIAGRIYNGQVQIPWTCEDAEFIAQTHKVVPALVAEVEYLREMLRDTRKIVRQKVKEVKTLQNACKNHKAKQEALEFHLKVSIHHAEEIGGELETEVAENEQLRQALEKVMEVEAPIMEGWETPAYKIACQALGGEAHE